MSDISNLIGKLEFIRDYECKTKPEVEAMDEAITKLSAEPEGAVMLDKETILQAGYKNREVEFRIGGRLFRVREVAQ